MVSDNFKEMGDTIGAEGLHVFEFRVSKSGSHKLRNDKNMIKVFSVTDIIFVGLTRLR
jgi:hypothetical protein